MATPRAPLQHQDHSDAQSPSPCSWTPKPPVASVLHRGAKGRERKGAGYFQPPNRLCQAPPALAQGAELLMAGWDFLGSTDGAHGQTVPDPWPFSQPAACWQRGTRPLCPPGQPLLSRFSSLSQQEPPAQLWMGLGHRKAEAVMQGGWGSGVPVRTGHPTLVRVLGRLAFSQGRLDPT